MLLPFHAVEHRIDSVSLPWEERRSPRRSTPERLRFDLPPPSLARPLVVAEPRPPRRPLRLRVRLGEWLMALGQRLAGPDIAS